MTEALQNVSDISKHQGFQKSAVIPTHRYEAETLELMYKRRKSWRIYQRKGVTHSCS